MDEVVAVNASMATLAVETDDWLWMIAFFHLQPLPMESGNSVDRNFYSISFEDKHTYTDTYYHSDYAVDDRYNNERKKQTNFMFIHV